MRFPNVYGIDMPTKEELVAHQASVDGLEGLERVVATIVGADRVVYQNLHDLEQAIQEEAKVCARVGRASCCACVVLGVRRVACRSRADLVPISCRSRADLVPTSPGCLAHPPPPLALVCRPLRRKRVSNSRPSSLRASTVPT